MLQEDLVARLELEYDLQGKICKAALRLTQDHSVAKSVRKQRKQSYHKAHQKVRLQIITTVFIEFQQFSLLILNVLRKY